jgi:hypothetical protein
LARQKKAAAVGAEIMKTVNPFLAFFAGLALVAFGLVAVPMTVSAIAHPLPVSCASANIAYDPGYGVSQLAAGPSCTVTAWR